MARSITHQRTSPRAALALLAAQALDLLPRGRSLPPDLWRRRHQAITILLWAHVPSIGAFGLIMGREADHVLAEAGLVVVVAAAASWERFSRRLRSTLASIGLLMCSAVLVHLSGGYIEFHFHYFVMVVVVAMYQDWAPFLLSIAFVLVQHGVMGALDPGSVYNHPDGFANPWKWAAIHAAFIGGACAAAIANWRFSETARAREEHAARQAADRAEDLAASEQRLRTTYEEVRRLNDELEQRVEERTRELAEANRELESFAYSVSHDLRAPLRSIDGFSQTLLNRYEEELPAQGRDYLRRVRASAQRMGQLIDDLLSLSRVTSTDMHREAVNLSEIARSIAEALQGSVPERQASFVIQDALVARGHRGLLRIVLENLLGNAWKFSRMAPHTRIELGATPHNGQVAYFVRDNGVGFEMAYVDKLFGAFQRLHGPEFEGTGIGLATVQRIVRRHGGAVWATSAVDQGATFYFTLPGITVEK